ncbi:MAG: hypothetical protein K6L74_13455 [Neptuniibacter sp.]
MLKTIASSPYLNLFSGVVLIVTAGSEVFNTFNEGGLGAHHGVFLFGLIQIVKTFPEFFHAIEEFEEAEESIAKVK